MDANYDLYVVGSAFTITLVRMLEALVELLTGLPPLGVLALAFIVAYVENLFPPSPSDVLLVFLGTIVGIGTVDFTSMLVTSTLGSVAGFSTAYFLGRRYGEAIVESPFVPFIDRNLVVKVERWFDRYHGLIIVANRFLSGTRAVISFVAGIVKMPFPRTLIYCAISAAAWNALLILVGLHIGSRWRDVESYLSAYGWVVTGAVLVLLAVWWYRKRKRRTTEE